ncbi:MAG: MotA/TolQ/ExbB proton channel family protein [Parvularculaceae bacterium]
MAFLRGPFEALQAFVISGGPVLMAILVLTFILWGLILERALYWLTAHGAVAARARRAWKARSDHSSWYAEAYRERLISEANSEATHFNGVIKVLVSVVPLLGLLGTVTGMVYVFDIMAVTGSSNARLMAEGISRATLPTMAGLFTSVSGVMFTYWYDSFARKATAKLADELHHS